MQRHELVQFKPDDQVAISHQTKGDIKISIVKNNEKDDFIEGIALEAIVERLHTWYKGDLVRVRKILITKIAKL